MNLLFPRRSGSGRQTPAKPDYCIRRLRVTLEAAGAQTLRLHISADSRYLLFFGGEQIGRVRPAHPGCLRRRRPVACCG